LGLCGILAHKLQATQVLLTDGDIETLAQLRQNVQRNNCATSRSVICPQLIWGHNLDTFCDQYKAPLDVIIGADIIYVTTVLQPLWETIDKLLSLNGKFLLAFTRRTVSVELVLEYATKYGFEWTCPENRTSVYVFTRGATTKTKREE
jgi:predicted nicotinamide N-methyase